MLSGKARVKYDSFMRASLQPLFFTEAPWDSLDMSASKPARHTQQLSPATEKKCARVRSVVC